MICIVEITKVNKEKQAFVKSSTKELLLIVTCWVTFVFFGSNFIAKQH